MSGKFLALLTTLLMVGQSNSLLAQLSDFVAQAETLEEAWEAEQPAIKAIKELGGWVKLADADDLVPEDVRAEMDPHKREFVVEVNMVYFEEEDGTGRLDNQGVSPDSLPHIGKCSQVRRVLLHDTQANDRELRHLAGLKHVEKLYIWDAGDVTDEGMKHLQGLTKLKYLHISNSQITDAGIGYLRELTEIEGLSLQGNNFTDKVLEHAGNFPRLESLFVGMGTTELTDEGLEHLENCQDLKNLGVQQAGISDDAATRLRGKLPNLDRVWH